MLAPKRGFEVKPREIQTARIQRWFMSDKREVAVAYGNAQAASGLTRIVLPSGRTAA